MDVPHAIEALLDLFPPHMIAQAIEYQTTCPDDSLDDWTPRHLLAAEYLCNYTEMTYINRYNKQVERLRKKLELPERPLM